MNITDFIKDLKGVDLSKVSYYKIRSLIINNLIRVPFTTALIKKGAIIERGRINPQEKFYSSEFEISYRMDLGNITKAGRANVPFRSMFYGAMPSNEIQMIREVLFSELVPEFGDDQIEKFEVEMTIGQWEVKEDFEVADVCFSEAYSNIPLLKRRFQEWIKKMEGTELGQEDFQKLLVFFADEFSKAEIANHHDYKLSCIYTDLAVLANKLNGICYPSVKANYWANNIAITPNAVERYLELKRVGMFKYEVDKNNRRNNGLFPTYFSDNLGVFNSKFIWKKYSKIASLTGGKISRKP